MKRKATLRKPACACDAFDAMTSERSYSKSLPVSLAVEELRACAGSQFDPRVVEAFRRIPREEWEDIRGHSLGTRERVATARRVEQVAQHLYTGSGAMAH